MLVCGDCFKAKNENPELSNEEVKSKVIKYRKDTTARTNNFLIVTVPQIEGKKIVKYYNMITSEVIIGTGFLSEVGASISDLFGLTGAYSEKLEQVKDEVYNDIINKAVSLGANAIISADTEYMKIGTNMIMFSITGTPVVVEDKVSAEA